MQASHQPPLLERFDGIARVEAYFITHARVSYVVGEDGRLGGTKAARL